MGVEYVGLGLGLLTIFGKCWQEDRFPPAGGVAAFAWIVVAEKNQ